MSVWVQSWSAVAARRGEFRSVSGWLGVDVDHSSAPVYALADGDQRIATRDDLLDARARHALALLGRTPPSRGRSGRRADEGKARTREYGRQHRSTLRSRR